MKLEGSTFQGRRARLEPVPGEGDPEGRLARLEQQGVLRRASAPLPLPRDVLTAKPPRPGEGASVLEALLAERRESR